MGRHTSIEAYLESMLTTQSLITIPNTNDCAAYFSPLKPSCVVLITSQPFDNGPNGVCTLAIPTVVSSSGVAVICDDRSRCLHISLNATNVNVESGSPYKWGVGVANFDRMILPRPASERQGDGALTLQSRAAYDWPHVRHPWLVEQVSTISGDAETFEGTADAKRCTSDTNCPRLKFCIGMEQDICDATEKFVIKQILRRFPTGCPIPPEPMMRHPIWTTWAKYKDSVTQDDVIQFAEEIVSRNLPRSVMEIDDRWSVKYGDLDFDPAKFPEPAAMVRKLHELGFLVTLWVIPFANTDSRAVREPRTRDFFVKDKNGDVGDFAWWQPTRVAALDVTQDAACDWFRSRLHRLQTLYKIDGFKFDAGEPSFLPEGSVTKVTMQCPSDYTRAWIRNVANDFALSEVRTGVSGTECSKPMLRLFDRFSTWGVENGLASVISGVLTASILGFPFVLPDMIGGNAYGAEVPNGELLIRWAQATAAMPSMQFSIPAWDFGKECAELCARALSWREKTFWPVIAETIPEASRSLAPIVRPVWWSNSRGVEQRVFTETGDQFMLGDALIVAPVVQEGARQRRAYLPKGQWQRVNLDSGKNEGEVLLGPLWLENVAADLDDMPTWRRCTS